MQQAIEVTNQKVESQNGWSGESSTNQDVKITY